VPTEPEDNTSLVALLEEIDATARDKERLALGDVVHAVGPRSFAPLLLISGLIIVAPIIGDIPGVPTIMGVMVILLSAQLLLHRRCVWLPRWLLARSIASGRIRKAVRWLRKPAAFIDRVTKPRYETFVRHAGAHVIAIACILISAATPLMELVPFSANLAGAAIAAFGLALFAKDGILAMCTIVASFGALGLIIYQLV
jgi:hypothetical protein